MNKKKVFLLTIIILFILSMFMYIDAQLTIKYPVGRDTVDIFGDAKYQIMKNPDRSLSLSNVALCIDIDENVYKYKQIGDLVYIHSSTGYTILNFKTNEVKQYANLKGCSKYQKDNYDESYERFNKKYGNKWIIISKFDDFTENEKEIFESMK